MAREFLDLVLQVDSETVPAAVSECRARMRPAQWALLVQFAAEVVLAQEAEATGRRVVLLPSTEAAEKAAQEVLGSARGP